MKKLKNGLLAIALLTGTVFMFNANESRGQTDFDEADDGHICCQSNSTGCIAEGGTIFPHDYIYFGSTCP